MSISIVVEDGSIVDGANSYVTIAETRTYALNRGITLSSDDDTVAAFLIKSTDYLEAQACRYQGYKVSTDQSLEFPRYDVYVNDVLLSYTEIPIYLKNAQNQLVINLHNGIELMPTVQPKNFVKRKKIGPIETEYSDPLNVGIQPTLTAVDALLAPLFGICANSNFALKTIRV